MGRSSEHKRCTVQYCSHDAVAFAGKEHIAIVGVRVDLAHRSLAEPVQDADRVDARELSSGEHRKREPLPESMTANLMNDV